MVFFYNLLKFDIVNADVPFCKRGHNLETEAKFSKAQHPFLDDLFLIVRANFHLIPSEDARKQTKNFNPYTQFYSIEKKTRNVFMGFL